MTPSQMITLICTLIFIRTQGFNMFLGHANVKSLLQNQIKEEVLKNSSTACSSAYQQIMNSENSHLFQTIFVSSGKSVHDLGNYVQCIRDTQLDYALVTVRSTAKYKKQVLMGLCVPSQCDSQALQIFNKMYKQLVIISGAILEPQDPIYTFPQRDKPSITIGAIAMSIVLLAIFALTIVGFFVENKQIGSIENQNTMVGTLEEEVQSKQSASEARRKKWALVIYSFSITKNFNEIFFKGNRTIRDKNFEVLNGLKVFMMIWIMLGTSYLIGYQYGTSNRKLLYITLNYFFSQLVLSADYAITMFYFLSAFILTFAFLKKYVQENTYRNQSGITDEFQQQKQDFDMKEILKSILRRFLRLFFPTVWVLFFTMTLFSYLGNGPAFQYLDENSLQIQLRSYWWTYLIFVSNVVPWHAFGGLFWITFIANDLLFFSFILIPSIYFYKNSKRRKIVYLILFLIMIISILYVVIFTVINGFSTIISVENVQNYNSIYRRPFGPMGYYALGIFVSFQYFEYTQAKYQRIEQTCKAFRFMNFISQSRKRCAIIQIIGGFILVFMIFIRYSSFGDYQDYNNLIFGRWPNGLNAAFNGISHYLVALSITMIFLPVFLGKLSIIRDIFASSFFTPLARIGFTASLLQGLVLTTIYFNQEQAPYFDNKNMIFVFFAVVFLVYLFSIPISIILEYPFRHLTKFIILPQKKIMRIKRDLARHLKSRNESSIEEEEREEQERLKKAEKEGHKKKVQRKRVKIAKNNLIENTKANDSTQEKLKINYSFEKPKYKEIFKGYKVSEFPANKKRVYSIAWNRLGTSLIAGAQDNTIKLFHLDEATLFRHQHDFKSHTEVVESLQWSPTNDQLFVSASADKSIKIWDIKSKQPVKTEKTKEENLNLVFNPDGNILAVSNDKEELSFYEFRNWKFIKSFKVADKNEKIEVTEFSWDKTGQLLFVADSSGGIRVYNGITLNSQPIAILDFHNTFCSALAMDHQNNFFVTGGNDSLMALWDLNSLMVKNVISNNEFKIMALSVSHDDKFIAQISEDDINKKYIVEIYDVESGETAFSYTNSYEKLALAWHPNKYILAVGGEDRKERSDKSEKNEGIIHLFHPQM